MANPEQAFIVKPDGLEMLSHRILGETTALYSELCGMANNNAAFRRGALDSVMFEVTEGDALEPVAPSELNEPEDDDDCYDEDDPLALIYSMMDSCVEVGYKFEARRKRDLIEDKQQVSMLFTFGVVAKHYGVQLPPQIAETEFGLPADEAVMQAGLVTEMRSQHYSFDSAEFKLMLCDSVAYFDDEDDIISQVCACPGDQDEVFYFPEEVREDDDGELVVDETEITQHQSDYAAERTERELIEFTDIEQAADTWRSMERAGEEVDVYDFERKVQAARIIVKNIRLTLLRQAGVELEA
jgi:hypothetical protein